MGKINKDTYKRAFALYVVSAFDKGIYGSVRFQKVVYEATKKSDRHPFRYKRYHHGQYSYELQDTNEQLLTLGYLNALPLDHKAGNDGNHYVLGASFDKSDLSNVLRRILGDTTIDAISQAVSKIGYEQQGVLLDLMHSELDKLGIQMNELIFDSSLPEQIELVGLDDDDCENIELILNPEFVSAMRMIAETCSKATFDASKVKRVYRIGE